MPQKQRIKRFEDIVGAHLCPDAHCHGLPGICIQNFMHLAAPPVAERVVDEVDGPDAARMGGPQQDASCPCGSAACASWRDFGLAAAVGSIVAFEPAVRLRHLRGRPITAIREPCGE